MGFFAAVAPRGASGDRVVMESGTAVRSYTYGSDFLFCSLLLSSPSLPLCGCNSGATLCTHGPFCSGRRTGGGLGYMLAGFDARQECTGLLQLEEFGVDESDDGGFVHR